MQITLSKKNFYSIVILIVIVVGGVFIARARSNALPQTPYAGTAGANLPTVVGEPTLDKETKIPFTETENYKEYTPELLISAKASGNATLLYFYADWCSSCRAQEPMNATFFNKAKTANLSVMGIRIDIDDHKDIAREYGINYQHSYVLLDKNGTPISKFFGEHTPDQLEAQISKVL